MISRIKNSLGFRVSRWYDERASVQKHNLVSNYFELRGQVSTFTTPPELLLLAKYASMVQNGSPIVEVGSYLGASTRYLLYGSRISGVDIHCVDTWMNETMPDGVRDTHEEFLTNISPHANRVEIHRCNSTRLTSDDLPKGVGLAFIDGDHDYEAVVSDVNLVIPNLDEEGVLAMHDIVAFKGVARCVGELLCGGTFQIIDLVENLVILRKAYL